MDCILGKTSETYNSLHPYQNTEIQCHKLKPKWSFCEQISQFGAAISCNLVLGATWSRMGGYSEKLLTRVCSSCFQSDTLGHSRLQLFARPPPRIAKGDEQDIRHADREPPWTASLPVGEKQSYLINCTLSVTHEVAYPKKNTYLIIHTNLVHFQRI